jgi:hypothetical protein
MPLLFSEIPHCNYKKAYTKEECHNWFFDVNVVIALNFLQKKMIANKIMYGRYHSFNGVLLTPLIT